MPSYTIDLQLLPPYFAEIPYYLWGQVNYDSEGDCEYPTDRSWSVLELGHREHPDRGPLHIQRISIESWRWVVTGPDPEAARCARFLVDCGEGCWIDPEPVAILAGWDHEAALVRAARVAQTFARPELEPFDGHHYFWGSWKWIGWYATEFTWVGRWIMHSVLTGDPRAVSLAIDWLKAPPRMPAQSTALRDALQRLTGRDFATDADWIAWYDTGGGAAGYPEADFDQWLADLKAQMGPDLELD